MVAIQGGPGSGVHTQAHAHIVFLSYPIAKHAALRDQAVGSGAVKPSRAIAASISMSFPFLDDFGTPTSSSSSSVGRMKAGSSSVLTFGVIASSSSVSVSSPEVELLRGVASRMSMGTSLSLSESEALAARLARRMLALRTARAFAHAHSSVRSLLHGSRARRGSPREGDEDRVGGEEGRNSQISFDTAVFVARRFGVAGMRLHMRDEDGPLPL